MGSAAADLTESLEDYFITTLDSDIEEMKAHDEAAAKKFEQAKGGLELLGHVLETVADPPHLFLGALGKAIDIGTAFADAVGMGPKSHDQAIKDATKLVGELEEAKGKSTIADKATAFADREKAFIDQVGALKLAEQQRREDYEQAGFNADKAVAAQMKEKTVGNYYQTIMLFMADIRIMYVNLSLAQAYAQQVYTLAGQAHNALTYRTSIYWNGSQDFNSMLGTAHDYTSCQSDYGCPGGYPWPDDPILMKMVQTSHDFMNNSDARSTYYGVQDGRAKEIISAILKGSRATTATSDF
jgi:hypothetical protein